MALRQIAIQRKASAETRSLDPLIKALRREFGDALNEFHSLEIIHAQGSSLLASGDKPSVKLVIGFKDDEATQALHAKRLLEYLEGHPLFSTIEYVVLLGGEDGQESRS